MLEVLSGDWRSDCSHRRDKQEVWNVAFHCCAGKTAAAPQQQQQPPFLQSTWRQHRRSCDLRCQWESTGGSILTGPTLLQNTRCENRLHKRAKTVFSLSNSALSSHHIHADTQPLSSSIIHVPFKSVGYIEHVSSDLFCFLPCPAVMVNVHLQHWSHRAMLLLSSAPLSLSPHCLPCVSRPLFTSQLCYRNGCFVLLCILLFDLSLYSLSAPTSLSPPPPLFYPP